MTASTRRRLIRFRNTAWPVVLVIFGAACATTAFYIGVTL